MIGKCFQGWGKEYNSKGICCCNCKWQSKLVKHPWNQGEFKGRISEQVKDSEGTGMWVCTAQNGVAMTMNTEHSMCEMHTPKGVEDGKLVWKEEG